MTQALFQQFLIILSFSLVGVVENPGQFSLLAEFGVVFLLFTLGLEFNFSRMLTMRFAVFGVGGVQVLVCTAVFAFAAFLWGASWTAAIMIAGTLALSSTAIVTRELLNNQ